METRGSTDQQTSQIKKGLAEESKPAVNPVGVEELSQEHFSSLRLLFFLVISVFLAEVVAMIVVYELPPLRYEYVTLIDAGIMTILIFPMLYFLAFQPLVRHISRRRQAEKAVEAQRKRFDNILEALPAYVVLLTPDYQVPFANRVFRERFGESEGKRCYEHLFGRSEPCEICETYKVLNIMAPTRWEWIGPDNHIYDVFDYPFTDADGSTMILEMGIDITEQKRAEEQVREMALFPTLNPGAVLRVNAGGQINKSNPAAEAMGFCVDAHLTEVMPELENLDLAYCIAAGTTQQVQETHWGDHVFQWTIRGVPEQGFAFLYGADITLRKQAEELNRQLSRIVEQTEDTVVVTDRNGVIAYVNPAFERLTGYTKEEALGKTPRVIKSNLHNNAFYQTMWNTILEGDVFQGEIANRKKSGEIFYEVKTITPLRDAQSNITHFVATGKDITEHKLAEEKLRKSYDELELRVWERTEELRVVNTSLEKEISERKQAEELVQQREAMFRAVLEQMPSGVTVRDAQTGKLVFSNVRSLEILHALAEIPQQFSEYRGFHPDGRAYPNEEWPLYRSMSTGEVINAEEIECERKDGTRFTIIVSSAPVYDAEGTIVNGVAVFDDITERKRAQAALQAANKELTRFNRAMIGRELRMIEMKKEVNDLCKERGQPPRYPLDFERDEYDQKP